jgi:hypothetical protein
MSLKNLDRKAFAQGFWDGLAAPAMLFTPPRRPHLGPAPQVAIRGFEEDCRNLTSDFKAAMGAYAAAH